MFTIEAGKSGKNSPVVVHAHVDGSASRVTFSAPAPPDPTRVRNAPDDKVRPWPAIPPIDVSLTILLDTGDDPEVARAFALTARRALDARRGT